MFLLTASHSCWLTPVSFDSYPCLLNGRLWKSLLYSHLNTFFKWKPGEINVEQFSWRINNCLLNRITHRDAQSTMVTRWYNHGSGRVVPIGRAIDSPGQTISRAILPGLRVGFDWEESIEAAYWELSTVPQCIGSKYLKRLTVSYLFATNLHKYLLKGVWQRHFG